MNIFVRPAVKADLAPLHQLFGSAPDYDPPEKFAGHLADSDAGFATFLVAEADGSVVGMVTAYTQKAPMADMLPAFETQKIPEMKALQVAPVARQQGVAKALVTALEQELQKQGHNQIGITVRATNGAAQRLYAKLGYLPDTHGLYYQGKPASQGDLLVLDRAAQWCMVKALA